MSKSRSSAEFLVDVRTHAEYSTGYLSNDLSTAVNIEYQSIAQLPEFYQNLGINVNKGDSITLYCRSGRRSNIALQTLRGLGYANVRDIGGFEEARALLLKEELGRRTDAERGALKMTAQENNGIEQRKKAFGALLDGLKALEE